MTSLSARVSRTARFLASLAPPVILFVGFIGVIGVVRARIEGGLGLALGILAAISLALGAALAYWVLFDWMNLRLIRRIARGGPAPRDGEVIAFEGLVRVDREPMTSPFTRVPCAAYAYLVSYSRESSSRGGRVKTVLAQGFHMLPTRIEGPDRSLQLRAFPSFEDALRKNETGEQWGERARALTAALAGSAPSASERERQSRLFEARHTEVDQVHQDYLMGEIGPNADALVIEEEALPLDKPITAVGTYDSRAGALSSRRSRLGPNLHIYDGRATDVSSRVGDETGDIVRWVAGLLVAGVLVLGLALAPPALTSKLPLIGSSVIVPLETTPEDAVPDGDAVLRERIAGWVREEFAAGNRIRALELAIDENAHESLRWLIAQGISPDTPIRVREDGHRVPLVEATRLGHLETARALLEAGADPNAVEPPETPSHAESTALGEAFANGYCLIAELLVEHGATFPEGIDRSRCP